MLVVFFMTDEPDPTPTMIDGQSGGQAILDMVAGAKAGCGGLDCVIGGGLAAAEMNALLADTLAEVIATTCDEIPPVG